MIPFKMTIVRLNTDGSYSVEYKPDNTSCTPITLNITVDSALDKNEVLDLLKRSSPQEFWSKEVNSAGSGFESLLNTTHSVTSIPTTSMTGQSSPETFVDMPGPTMRIGRSTPETVAGVDERNILKLKLLIQQVIQEMADSTV